MSPPWDVLGVGAAMGGAAGIFAGYQLRKLVVRIQAWNKRRKKDRITKQDVEMAYRHDVVVTIKEKELPSVIPIRRSKRSTPRTPEVQPQRSANPDRDDVIAALMGAGYSKTAAVKAVDACSLAERASGVEHWTIAALRHAHGAK